MEKVFYMFLGILAWDRIKSAIKNIQEMDSSKFASVMQDVDAETKRLMLIIRNGGRFY